MGMKYLPLTVALIIAFDACCAQPTTAISFQGALAGSGGQPLANGNYNLTFKIYDVPAGSTALATSNVPSVPVIGGIASTPIPAETAWFNGQTRYLGIDINGGEELSPRVLITAVPYAFHSQTTRGIAVDSMGRVGIGTTDPYGTLSVVADSGQPALVIGNSNPGTSPLQLIMDSWAQPSGAIRFALLAPFAHVSGYRSGPDANVMYWNGSALSFGSPDGGRPLFNVGIGTRTPKTDLDVNGTARMTVCQITSDRNAKQDFVEVNGRYVLAKLAVLSITTWSYTNNPTLRHIGPVAQDFQAAFAVGEDDKHIATVDADGVALAAIQGLNSIVEEKEVRITALEKRVAHLEEMLRKTLPGQ